MMKYKLFKFENGGWHYTITSDSDQFSPINGWRSGTKAQVEEYLKGTLRKYNKRMRGDGIPLKQSSATTEKIKKDRRMC